MPDLKPSFSAVHPAMPALPSSAPQGSNEHEHVSYHEKPRPASDSNTALSEESAATRPPLSHSDDDDGPPPLNYSLKTGTRERWIGIFFSLLFIESGVLPLILFYSLQWGAHLSIRKNLAIITSLVGTVSGLKVAQRTWFLLLRNGHESRRPIGAGRWGFDFFHILINIGLAAFFTPLVIGSSLTPASPPTVAMALPCFMLVMCIPMFISSLDREYRLPVRVSSFPPHYPLPPLTYTIVEDVIAVDGGGLLDFRQAWRLRYESSRVMRKLLRDVGLFWGITGIAVAGGCIAVAWTTSDDIGYGIGYGIPWLWAMVCTVITIWWAKRELRREREEWSDTVHVHREKPLHLIETQDDRSAAERVMARRSSMRITRATTLPAPSLSGHGIDAGRTDETASSTRSPPRRFSIPPEMNLCRVKSDNIV